MKHLLPLDEINPGSRLPVGGKCRSLARLAHEGFPVPKTCCIPARVYRNFIAESGLKGKLALELSRKRFTDMRWEEMWDASLRIRNLFTTVRLPAVLREGLQEEIEKTFGTAAVAVRSSALSEDAEGQSFAGLHESYLNISGAAEILEYIKKVWASLWSDAAILYRKELHLDIRSSAMAVVVQEFLPGEVSGVAFGVNPLNPAQTVIEAVPGLNEGLVGGRVEPDRWVLERSSGELLSSSRAERQSILTADASGVQMSSAETRGGELLTSPQIEMVFRLVQDAEEVFGSPQDVEWTFRDGSLFILQSRPITRAVGRDQTKGTNVRDGKVSDKRSWYLSLRPNYERLAALREKIEKNLIPEMIREADELAETDLEELSDEALSDEILRREQILNKWRDVYWEEFIPFAHGVRLFGKVYNDTVKPSDPFEFVDLLRPEKLESLERDRLMEGLAEIVRKNPQVREPVLSGRFDEIEQPEFKKLLEELRSRSGTLFAGTGERSSGMEAIGNILLEIADSPGKRRSGAGKISEKTGHFFAVFPEDERQHAAELLELGRSSYRFRDDDNLYLGRIEGEFERALEAGRGREKTESAALAATLERLEAGPFNADPLEAGGRHSPTEIRKDRRRPSLEGARQLVGQPAGAGLVTAPARVVLEQEDLYSVKHGEVLVCDALDPNMTFVIPLAAGVVERRGGMLIHGAIIAREYGLPCVTGIPDVTEIIHTGDRITVDGYLGIVVLQARLL